MQRFRDPQASHVIDVIDGSADFHDRDPGTMHLDHEVRVDPGPGGAIDLVEPSKSMKSLPIAQQEIARGAREKRRFQVRLANLVCTILQRRPLQADLIDAELDVAARCAVHRAGLQPPVGDGVHDFASQQDVGVRDEHERSRRATDADVLGDVLQVWHSRILGHRRLVLRCDDDGAAGRVSATSGSSCASISQSSGRPGNRIPFDQNQFVWHAALRQSFVVEAQRRGDALAEVSSVVVVPGCDDDADKQRG